MTLVSLTGTAVNPLNVRLCLRHTHLGFPPLADSFVQRNFATQLNADQLIFASQLRGGVFLLVFLTKLSRTLHLLPDSLLEPRLCGPMRTLAFTPKLGQRSVMVIPSCTQDSLVLRLQRSQLRLALLLQLTYAHGRLLCRLSMLRDQSSHRSAMGLLHRHLLSVRLGSTLVHMVNHLVQSALLCMQRIVCCPELVKLSHSLLGTVHGFTVFRPYGVQCCLALRPQQVHRLVVGCSHRRLRCLQAVHLCCVLLSQLCNSPLVPTTSCCTSGLCCR